MASRKMTFTLPEPLAVQLTRTVPARHRSRYLAEALASKLAEREQQFIRACDIANQDPDVLQIEQEFAELSDETSDVMREPWSNYAPPR
jgi:hypothetical protein